MGKQKELHPTSGYTVGEERANAITHLIGFFMSVVALVVAVVFASREAGVYLVVACAIYGSTLILLHLASSCYHAVRDLKWKRRFLAADHSCIYLLIAGTYTPFALGPLRGPVGWSLFGLIWGLAIAGVAWELFRPKRGTWVSTAIYLVMGWLVILFLFPLAKAISGTGLGLLLTGGLVYTLGVIFYKWHSLKYHHAIWHLMVMAGAAFQYFAVLSLLTKA